MLITYCFYLCMFSIICIIYGLRQPLALKPCSWDTVENQVSVQGLNSQAHYNGENGTVKNIRCHGRDGRTDVTDVTCKWS